MWISRKEYKALHEQNTEIAATGLGREGYLRGQLQSLQTETVRLRADLDWFKHRLNHVELERGQLIQAAIGVKVAVPEFVPSYDPEKALNGLPDLSSVGGDAAPDTFSSMTPDVDYSQLPGYKRSE